jgi:hypothetical protein
LNSDPQDHRCESRAEKSQGRTEEGQGCAEGKKSRESTRHKSEAR